jgi:glucose dehydrogenase
MLTRDVRLGMKVIRLSEKDSHDPLVLMVCGIRGNDLSLVSVRSGIFLPCPVMAKDVRPLPESSRSEAARLLGAASASKAGKASAAATPPAERKRRATAGGKASQAKLTPEQRSARGKAAADARWAKTKRKDETP